MESETEASESSIGTDSDSAQFDGTIRAFIGQVNNRFRSQRVFNDIVNVVSAVGTTAADSDGSCTNGSGYANLSNLGIANRASLTPLSKPDTRAIYERSRLTIRTRSYRPSDRY
jgi:hypothetical protein